MQSVTKLRAGWGKQVSKTQVVFILHLVDTILSSDGAQYQFGNQFYYLYRPEQYNPDLVWKR